MKGALVSILLLLTAGSLLMRPAPARSDFMVDDCRLGMDLAGLEKTYGAQPLDEEASRDFCGTRVYFRGNRAVKIRGMTLWGNDGERLVAVGHDGRAAYRRLRGRTNARVRINPNACGSFRAWEIEADGLRVGICNERVEQIEVFEP